MVEFVARRARQVKLGKVYPYAAITKRLAGQELAEIGLLKAAGAVAFTDGERALANARVMRRALAYATGFDALIVQHPEEPALAEHGVMNEGQLASRLGLAGITPAAETMMVERDLRLVELTGGRLHFAHVSTGGGIGRDPRRQGARPAGHLRHGPALPRAQRARGRRLPDLRQGLAAAALARTTGARWSRRCATARSTSIASDHCPQDQDSKRLPFAQAACGVIGVQTMLAVCLRLVHEGELGLLALLRTMTEAPARHPGPRCRAAGQGCPRRPGPVRPGRALEDHREQPEEPVQEHGLRGAAGRGADPTLRHGSRGARALRPLLDGEGHDVPVHRHQAGALVAVVPVRRQEGGPAQLHQPPLRQFAYVDVAPRGRRWSCRRCGSSPTCGRRCTSRRSYRKGSDGGRDRV